MQNKLKGEHSNFNWSFDSYKPELVKDIKYGSPESLVNNVTIEEALKRWQIAKQQLDKRWKHIWETLIRDEDD